MDEIGWGKHTVILVAMVINLWVGGDLVEVWLGHFARSIFELTLILGWLTLIVGMRAPVPWRYGRREEEQGDRGDERERRDS